MRSAQQRRPSLISRYLRLLTCPHTRFSQPSAILRNVPLMAMHGPSAVIHMTAPARWGTLSATTPVLESHLFGDRALLTPGHRRRGKKTQNDYGENNKSTHSYSSPLENFHFLLVLHEFQGAAVPPRLRPEIRPKPRLMALPSASKSMATQGQCICPSIIWQAPPEDGK